MFKKFSDFARKQLINLSCFHLPFLWYICLNTINAALEKNFPLMITLIISICFFVTITLVRRLFYKKQAEKLIFFQHFTVISSNIAMGLFQFIEINSSNMDFRLVNSIYGEIVFLNTIKIRFIKYLSIFFQICCISVSDCFTRQEIIFISLMKIGVLIIFSSKNSNSNNLDNSLIVKKIRFFKGEKEDNFHYEIKLRIDKNFQLHSYDEDLEKTSFSIEESLNRLKNLDFLLLRQFLHVPSANEYNQCFIGNEIFQKKSENFEDFFKKICQNDNKNIFFVGDVSFFDELVHDLITIYKLSTILIIKIKKDECYNQLFKAIRTNNCYSKAISFVAHEFRTPLNCITSMLQSLDQQVDPHLSKTLISPANISSKFLLNMSNDLLDIAQIEAETFKLVLTEFDLLFILKDTMQMVTYQASKRKIEIKLDFDASIQTIRSDPNRIRQILINLLSINYFSILIIF